MNADEQFVREQWEWADLSDRRRSYPPFSPCFEVRCGLDLDAAHRFSSWGITPLEAWAAAAQFTRQRLEEIRLLEEEIVEIKDDLTCYVTWRDDAYDPAAAGMHAIYSRILAREQAALAELKKGMRAPNHQEGDK